MKRFRSGLNFDLFTASERSAFVQGKAAELVMWDRAVLADRRDGIGRLCGLILACLHKLPSEADLMCRPRPA